MSVPFVLLFMTAARLFMTVVPPLLKLDGRQSCHWLLDATPTMYFAFDARTPVDHASSSRSPAMPATISAMHSSRSGEALSPKRKIPSTATPTPPMPVHTAYAVQ